MTTTGKKPHWERRNAASREKYLRLNHEQNAARAKQVWVAYAPEDRDSGFWDRPMRFVSLE